MRCAQVGEAKRSWSGSLELAVGGILEHAIAEHRRVALQVRSGVDNRHDPYEIEGRPVRLFVGADGRDRVQIEISAGETEQIVPLERIVRVVICND